MSKLKNFDEFVNENLVIGGNYNYFGPGSLDPIIQKLLGEGKNESIIRSYLTSLGVEPWRIDNAMSKYGGAEFTGEKKVNEAAKKATFEEKANKFLSELNEDDEVNEAQKFKGKEIFPNWVKSNELKGMIRKESDLTKGARYALLDLGLDVWQAEYEYEGKVGPIHIFKSTAQGTGADSNIEFSDKELKDAVKNAEIALMEATEEQINEAKVNKNARRTIRPFNKVKPGNVALDYNDEPYTVVGVGKASELYDFDDSGIAADEMDPDEDAIAVVGTVGRGGAPAYAVYSYMPDGAVVYESEVNEAKKYTIKDIISAYKDAFGEDIMKGDRVDIIDDIKSNYKGKVTVDDLKVIYDDRYGEEIESDFLDALGESVNEAKKKTFEDAAAAFLLGLAGSDQIDEEDKEKVDEKLNKETLQVEGDGEDIDDMIDDLADGDEDEFQGPDDEAPESDEKEEDGSDLEKAVASAKKDKEKLDKIKDILMGEAKEVELDADGKEETDKEDIEDEETGDEIEVEEPADESKVEEADDKWSADVKPKWTPPAGLFTEPAAKIADVLHKDSEDLDQAMSRLMFYINRAGKLLSPKDKANLELAKKLLQKKYA